MMNEYLCRNYVAKQILSDMGVTRADSRMGSPAGALKDSHRSYSGRPKKVDLTAVKESLLADQGSSHYKNWLAR
jgi:hypothetical protein